MKNQTPVFEVGCPAIDSDWYEVNAKNRYEAVEEFCANYDAQRDKPWFPEQTSKVKLLVRDPEGKIFDMEVGAEFVINYNISDVES